MIDDDTIYKSWIIKGSYFNRMLDCGDMYNQWVQNALEYLPRNIFSKYKEKIAFVAMGQRDGCRLAKKLCKSREIILLSEHVLPKSGANEGESDVRYFIYVVLHEVAHVIKQHRSPIYDSLTNDKVEIQEAEADDMALKWFNDHVNIQNNPNMPFLSKEEINIAKGKSQDYMKKLYNGA
jgi:hypothetical protein